MPLHLRIENESSLPDGGPVSYAMAASHGGINIGRDHYLDWVLPDPTRFVSGTHCEIRFRDGGYWLHDVSTNGTFLNGSEFRMTKPHRLQSGDRLEIGKYQVVIEIEPEQGATSPVEPDRYIAPHAEPPKSESQWDLPDHEAPSAIPRRDLDLRKMNRGLNSPDFLDWMADIPVLAPRPNEPVRSDPGREAIPPAARSADPPASWTPESDLWSAAAPPVSPDPLEQRRPLPPANAPGADMLGVKPRQPSFDEDVASAAPSWDAPAFDDTAPAPQSVAKFEAPGVQTPPARASTAPAGTIIARFAKGANLPVDAISEDNAGDLAEMLGEILHLTAENLRQFQVARVQFKGKIRSSNHTVAGITDINPLRFAPSVEAALRIMLGPRQKGYLKSQDAIKGAFDDLRQHQLGTVSAMQVAIRKIFAELDPKSIDAAIEADRGVGKLLSSRKAKLWEKYESTWEAQFGGHEDGAINMFLRLFAEAYDSEK